MVNCYRHGIYLHDKLLLIFCFFFSLFSTTFNNKILYLTNENKYKQIFKIK